MLKDFRIKDKLKNCIQSKEAKVIYKSVVWKFERSHFLGTTFLWANFQQEEKADMSSQSWKFWPGRVHNQNNGSWEQ